MQYRRVCMIIIIHTACRECGNVMSCVTKCGIALQEVDMVCVCVCVCACVSECECE